MALFNLGYAGIGVVTATFALDETTKTAIGTNYDGAKGKAVALTATNTVGYGAVAGSPLFGVIEKVDARGLASISVKGFFEDVPIKKFGTTPAYPTMGEIGLGVDDTGSVVKLTAGKKGQLTGITSTDGDTSTSTILL